MRLLMLKGLPASGKSTYAKELVRTQDYYRVNKDDLRAMVHDGRWGKEREKFILHWRDRIIMDSLGGLKNVVVDDTNLHPKHETTLRAIAEVYGAEFEVKFFDTPLAECIARDAKRENPVGAKVIRGMHKDFFTAPVYNPPEGAPEAILVDIDGTLAHHKGRSPYDWMRVGEDKVDEVVRGLVNQQYLAGVKVIIMSGRDAVCREITEKWLDDNMISYNELFMRAKDDNRKDSIVKKELFDSFIKHNYNVKFVLDDRDQVVDMWRNELGLKVLQVAEGAF